MPERRIDRMTDSCEYRSLFDTKKTSLSSKRFYESMIKTTLLFLQIYVQKYPKEVEKNCLKNVGEKNADRIYAEIVSISMKQTTPLPAI